MTCINTAETSVSRELCRRTHTILRNFVKAELSGGLFTRLSFDADKRATLARLGRLVLFIGPVYSHLHAAPWSEVDGWRSAFPFYAATSLEVGRAARPIISTTVSRER
jgi:hypothetical protein